MLPALLFNSCIINECIFFFINSFIHPFIHYTSTFWVPVIGKTPCPEVGISSRISVFVEYVSKGEQVLISNYMILNYIVIKCYEGEIRALQDNEMWCACERTSQVGRLWNKKSPGEYTHCYSHWLCNSSKGPTLFPEQLHSNIWAQLVPLPHLSLSLIYPPPPLSVNISGSYLFPKGFVPEASLVWKWFYCSLFPLVSPVMVFIL